MRSEEDIWRHYDAAERRLSAALSERMLDLAQLQVGMRVLDVGTGRGEPAIPAAHRVAPTGVVVGLDRSAPLLQMARERAVTEGVTNLELRVVEADALLPSGFPPFDAALARWVLMYLEAPMRALTAIRTSLRAGGRLVAALWAEPSRVPYYTVPRHALLRYLPVPVPDPVLPGMFRYSSVSRIHADFAAAGFVVEHLEEFDVAVMEATTDDELIAWSRAFGMDRLLACAPTSIQAAWERDFVGAASAYRREGVVRLGGVTRIVVATPA